MHNIIRPFLIFTFAFIFPVSAQVDIPEGTRVQVRLEERLSSETANQGQKIRFTVTENVEVNGKTVIDQGAPVTGTITVVEPRHRMGKDGKLEFSVDRVASVDGQPVELRSEKQGKKNEKGITGKTVSAITTAPLMSKKERSARSKRD